MDLAVETALRARIIAWVTERAEARGFLERDELLEHRVDGRKLPVIDFSRGIRNPGMFSSTLSIVSSAHGPYDDIESGDGFLHYAYRAGDPAGGDNRKLRNAVVTGEPLILFRKEEAGVYVPTVPVYAIEDRPEERCVIIALDEAFRFLGSVDDLGEPQREYARRLAKQRLHQPAFRARVMRAYETRCAVCRIRHGEFLDAAHILPDSHEHGLPTVNNGLALCKIHHTAYDRDIMGISPDYRVTISGPMLREEDGPMLKHGLQEMHGQALTVPQRRGEQPDRGFLDWRYRRFTANA